MMNKRWITISILSLLFIVLAVLVKTNSLVSFDTNIYNLITTKMSDTLTSLFKIFTFFGSTKFIVGLVIFFLVLFIILKKNKIGYTITAVLIISTIMNNLIKIIIRRPRPEVLALVTEKTFSFPSGHAMAAVSMYGVLIYLLNKSKVNNKLKIFGSTLLIIMIILVMISRIYLGAHFASDIIGAALLSLILLLIEIDIIERKKWLK